MGARLITRDAGGRAWTGRWLRGELSDETCQRLASLVRPQPQIDAFLASIWGCGTAQIVRRYRERPSPLVRDTIGGWRTGRIDRVLIGDFGLFAGAVEPDSTGDVEPDEGGPGRP